MKEQTKVICHHKDGFNTIEIQGEFEFKFLQDGPLDLVQFILPRMTAEFRNDMQSMGYDKAVLRQLQIK